MFRVPMLFALLCGSPPSKHGPIRANFGHPQVCCCCKEEEWSVNVCYVMKQPTLDKEMRNGKWEKKKGKSMCAREKRGREQH